MPPVRTLQSPAAPIRSSSSKEHDRVAFFNYDLERQLIELGKQVDDLRDAIDALRGAMQDLGDALTDLGAKVDKLTEKE